jgi:hypothetical protein
MGIKVMKKKNLKKIRIKARKKKNLKKIRIKVKKKNIMKVRKKINRLKQIKAKLY